MQILAPRAMTDQSQEIRPNVRFAQSIVLTKREAFEVCEVCADVERVLLRVGRAADAARLASLFEMFESRLVVH